MHELLCARFSVNMVQAVVVDSVCDRTSGNALYCIELANTMLQRGVLKVYNGVCNLAISLEDLDTIGLPNSLHAAMSTQLDRLSVACAACMKSASVMGMQFPAVVLSALSDDVVDAPAAWLGRMLLGCAPGSAPSEAARASGSDLLA